MRRGWIRLLGWLLMAVAVQPVTHAAAGDATLLRAGQSLAEALRALQNDGFGLIFTSALVPDELRVDRVPVTTDRAATARELLAAHGLALQAVGPRLYVVVRAAPENDPASDSAAEPTIAEVVISASRYRLRDDSEAPTTLLAGAQLGSQPGLGEDALRSLNRVPGLAQNSLSAAAYVRGGDGDETLVLLDGYPLRQPYHLPGYQSLFSVLDPSLIATAEIFTGGFPARYGDRMSAVFDLTTRTAEDPPRHALGLSFFNASARAGGELPGAASADWLAMGRIGTLRTLISAINPDVGLPSYGDTYARVSIGGDGSSRWSLNALLSRDELTISDEDRGESGLMESDASYLWLHGDQSPSDRLRLRSWFGYTRLNARKFGTLDDAGAAGVVHDRRVTQVWDVRGRADWLIDTNRQLETGIEWSTGHAAYAYDSTVTYSSAVAALFGRATTTVQNAALRPHRDDIAAYGSYRQRLGGWWFEAGARARRIMDRNEATRLLLEPRVAIRRDAGAATALRFTWGQFYQHDGLDQLRVADGSQRFGVPQRSVQMIAGIEQQRGGGLTWRAEAFGKLQLDPRPHFENQLDALSIVPELAPDRVRIAPDHAELRGIELSIEQAGHPWSWWASYVWSQSFDEFAGSDVDVPRSWDQQHAINVGLEWQRGDWSTSALLNAHSGWPTSRVVRDNAGVISVSARNSERLATFASLDLRANWRHRFRPGTLTLSLEVTNALDRKNPCCQELVLTNSLAEPIATREINWLPLLPALSLLWEF